ncbi:MAG: non-heme iron oxygenase ferredoxin subunit [Rhodospirillaceae bacterium]|jgi:nitrite reductase/ring-hydroxylating ferredoxin subunit|nr:non-heme iron oxygenase ferredoxin subunit [Rhodospirillaceae bacterium]MBT4588527.1 non-heme iron oxygenase ferredoxin subunit [Rhodospirillaceae bacterium]MBT4938300.1 non-heme iron oxygenase ferredoxin subunit [Rhodospirillaceae bacterium]MBT5938545.1 non-heme iron oxygenase ferredoxin subunit [Rhodospirillaceae bacterium]MBT7268167.1 non-heme iron oxygenase ferredoxin subunit [Rhodospirillaceae bacterium]
MSKSHPICPVAELEPGSVKHVKIGDQDIGVYNLGGEFYAIDDICTHMRARLSDGYINDDIIECPVHFGKFNIKTGEAAGAPCTIGVNTHEVSVEEGVVSVHL